MTDKCTPRANIADYIITTADDTYVLLKDPVDWGEGETKRVSTEVTKGIDIKALCALLCEGSTTSEITYEEMYQICEVVLQMEESGQEVFPK